MTNKGLERLFQAGAGVLMLAAAYFLWRGDSENVFVSAALGSLSFFISIRFQVKERLKAREAEDAGTQKAMPVREYPDPQSAGIEKDREKEDYPEHY